MIDEKELCNMCHGRGEIITSNSNQIQNCPECNGLGDAPTLDTNDEAVVKEVMEAAKEMFPLPNEVALIDIAIVTKFERQAFITGAKWARMKLLHSRRTGQARN